jgi:3',5'-cyclic AMP phosphodiesterase CpdA
VTSSAYTLRRAKRGNEGFRLVVLGDGRTDTDEIISRHRDITRKALAARPDLAIHSGDMVSAGTRDHWDIFWRRIATRSHPDDPGPAFASQIPYVFVLGNHEVYGGARMAARTLVSGNPPSTLKTYRAYVDAPPNDSPEPTWEEHYFAFSYGPARFIVLDTNNTSRDDLDNSRYMPDGFTADWEPGSAQYRWLERELRRAQAEAAFTFVAMHPAPYSRGAHGSPEDAQSGYPLRLLDPLFRRYGVDAVLAGHDHMAERCLTGPAGFERTMADGDEANLNYFVVGNSGHSTRLPGQGWQQWLSVGGDGQPPYYSRYYYDWTQTEFTSYLDVVVEQVELRRWRAQFRVVRSDGRIFDPVVLERQAPSPPSSPGGPTI